MGLDPINLQLGNYNVENIAQTSRNSIAPALQTGQMEEMIKENIKRAQEIQPSDEIDKLNLVHRKTDEEHRQGSEQDEKKKKNSDNQEPPEQEAAEQPKALWGTPIKKDGRYDFYV